MKRSNARLIVDGLFGALVIFWFIVAASIGFAQ